MNTRSSVVCPNGGTPPIGKPVVSRTVSASTRAHFAPAGGVGQLLLVELVGAADVGEHDFAVDGEDQALDDLADIYADRRGGVGRGLGALGEAERGSTSTTLATCVRRFARFGELESVARRDRRRR